MTVIALQMDDIATIFVETDTTFALALEAQKRGYSLFYYQPEGLFWEDGEVKAKGAFVSVRDSLHDHVTIGAAEIYSLKQAACVLIRQNPPFNMAYITATYLLEFLPPHVKVLNNPRGIRNAPEKLIGLRFADFSPPTLISRDIDSILCFIEKQGQVVIKPLFEFGGQGVLKLNHGDGNTLSVLEIFQKMYKEPFVVQKFIKQIEQGDKRILLINGNPVGIFNRLPLPGQTRSNMRVGGTPYPCDYSARDTEICQAIGPTLREMGLFFVGIDVIGPYLTEINATSPTGLRVMNKLYNLDLAALFWNEASF